MVNVWGEGCDKSQENFGEEKIQVGIVKGKELKDGRLEEWCDILEVRRRGSGLGKKTAGLGLDILTSPTENQDKGLKSGD